MGRLHHLELVNFKSYKGTQIIGPFSNFSAVIGPNGSGKSNLMDAISFVLGVKSNQLRSAQLKDLMYKGAVSENESVEGASVSAVFMDSNGSETTFTRRISSKNQNSEYRIDNRVVSWSKYNEALEDENILVKAKNFLVFQGDVEAIASQNPKELTKLIEQITKRSLELKEEYEQLKASQEKATESSAITFNKKKTVNAEMKQFKEQKEEAERYDQYVNKRDALMVTHSLWSLFHIEEDIKRLHEEILENVSSVNQFEAEKIIFDSTIKDRKKAHARATKDVIKIENSIKTTTQRKEDKKPQMLKAEEALRYANKKILTAKANKNECQKTLDSKSKDVDELEQELRQLQKAKTKFEESAQKRINEAGPVLNDIDTIEFNRIKRQVEETTISQKQKITSIERQAQISRETKMRLENNLTQINAKLKSIKEETIASLKKKEGLLSRANEAKKELAEKRREIELSDVEKRRLTRMEVELKEKIMDANNRLMQARIDRTVTERETKMKEAISSLKRIYPGVYGRLIDLCKPSHRKYDVAASIILGRNLDAIVVDKEKTALECIRYMRDQRVGQATFLPLDTLKVKSVNEKYRTIAKGAKLAVDVIEHDSNVELAIHYACGNALVCDSMEIAKHICYEKRQEVKAVTLDGTVIHKTGMITGGQLEAGKESKRWEEKEVENLRKARETLHDQIQDVGKKLRKLNQEDQLLAEATRLESELESLSQSVSEFQRKLDALCEEKSHLDNQIEIIGPDLQMSLDVLDTAEQDIRGLDAEIKNVENQLFKDLCKRLKIKSIREYEETQHKINQETKEKQLRFTTSIAKLEFQISFEKQSIDECNERIKRLDTAIKLDMQSVKDLERENSSNISELALMESELHNKKKSLQEAQEIVKDAQIKLSDAKKELETFTKTFESQKKLISSKETELDRLFAERLSILKRCKLEEIDVPLLDGKELKDISMDDFEKSCDDMDVDDNLLRRLDIVNLDFSKLKKDLKQNGSADIDVKLREDIRVLSMEIEKLAPHIRAVDKFGDIQNKLKATSEEFENSRKEARTAKEQFHAVKNERYKRFYRAYNHISEQIDRIYKELTRSKAFPLGGTAYLSLEDTEEPYLDGIKYHAMPPMKRFREMELLSGGEKTVAALALLFAIHSYQPAPFFVLDEVDAALDNTNVAKIASYIKKHASNEFQFIVISLKNTFYENAESLVGVYKDNAEISSKVLTLDLSEYEE